jgi:large subunit ribosomal protein L21
MSYAVIAVGGKQYFVHEGERLLVDRLSEDEGALFRPRVLLVAADGDPSLAAGDVTARVVRHTLGQKVRIGKYKPKKGYRRHTGFRARLSQIQIESIAAAAKAPAARAKAAEEPAAKAETAAKAAPARAKAAPKPGAAAAAKSPARAAKAAEKPAPAKAPVARKPAAKATAAKATAAKPPAKAKVPEAKKPAPKKPSRPRKSEEK